MPIPVLLSAEVNMQAIFTQLGEGFFDDGRHLFPDAGAEHAAGPFGRFWAHVKNKAFELADTIFYQCYARDATDAATHGGIFCARVPDC